MPNVDAKMAEIAEQLLRRPLTDDEHFEILRIADVMGMSNVHVRPDRSLLKVV